MWITYRFLDRTKLLELLAKSLVVGVPGKASVNNESQLLCRTWEALTQ